MKTALLLSLIACLPAAAQEDGDEPAPQNIITESTGSAPGNGMRTGPSGTSIQSGGITRQLGGGGGGGGGDDGGVSGGGVSLGGAGISHGKRETMSVHGPGAAAATGGGGGCGTVGGKSAGPNGPLTDADVPPCCPKPGKNVVVKRIYPGQGSINFVFDEPRTDGQPPTIYAYRLPTLGGRMSKAAGFEFVRTEVESPAAARIGFSRCPGDFSFGEKYSYKLPPPPKAGTHDKNGCLILADGESSANHPGEKCYGGSYGAAAANTAFNPCYSHGRGLDSFTMSYMVGKPGGGDDAMGWIGSCPIPPQPDGRTWYLNVQYADDSGKGTCHKGTWQCSNAFVWHGGSMDAVGWYKNGVPWADPLPEEKNNEFYDRGPVANHYRAQH